MILKKIIKYVRLSLVNFAGINLLASKVDKAFEASLMPIRVTKLTYSLVLGSIFSLFVLISCSQQKDKEESYISSVADMRELEQIVPLDANLSDKYKRSCLNCHANPDALAPLVHDIQAWDKLINEKGMETLQQNVINGYESMPPKGQCADCTEEDLKMLIEFLSGIEH